MESTIAVVGVRACVHVAPCSPRYESSDVVDGRSMSALVIIGQLLAGQKRTNSGAAGLSAKCQLRPFALQVIESLSRSKTNGVMWLNILDAIKRCDSNLPTIVCPVQQSLPLPRAAKRITGLAVHFYLIDVATKCLPALDLPSVFLRHPPAHVIPAVPLKPPARIIVMKPAFEAPLR